MKSILCCTLIQTFFENAANIYSVCFHPSKNMFAAVGSPPVMFVWDLHEGQEIKGLFGDHEALYHVLFLDDYLIATGKSGKVVVFNRNLEREVEFFVGNQNTPVPNFSLALTMDKKTLAIGTLTGAIYFYEVGTWEFTGVLKAHNTSVRAIEYSPSGEVLATGGSDRIVRFFDAKTNENLFDVEGHGGTVFSLSFSKDGSSFATGCQDARLRIWDVTEGGRHIQPKVKFFAHAFAIKSVCFIHGNKYVVSVSQDKTMKVWDVEKSLAALVIQSHQFTINSLSLSSDETMLVTGSDDKTIKLWKIV